MPFRWKNRSNAEIFQKERGMLLFCDKVTER